VRRYPELFRKDEWAVFIGELVPDVATDRPRDFPEWAPPDRAPLFRCAFCSGVWFLCGNAVCRLMSTTLPDLMSGLNLRDTEGWAKWARSGVLAHGVCVSVCLCLCLCEPK
jgi:hypothetical protein